MIYQTKHFGKRYIQFNDLVFDAYDMISDYDNDYTFKGNSIERSFGHGSYAPYKRNYMFIGERSISMTITLQMLKVPCEYRQFYARFAEEELSKVGKLWAIKNGELIWAFASVTNMSEIPTNRPSTMVWDVEFKVPHGVWYKADKQKTFLVPYDVCTVMDCKGYKTLQPCESLDTLDIDCCNNCLTNQNTYINDESCDCCCNNNLTADMALCYHLNELDVFYTCEVPYQIIYDCQKAQQFNGDDFLGQKICNTTSCETGIISGRFYSETDLPTQEMSIVIVGHLNNAWVTINGNTNIIEGEYDGALIIKPSGDVYFQSAGCYEPELLDASVWVKPNGMEYGWTVNPRDNSIIVNTNNCCTGACVYIQDVPITA